LTIAREGERDGLTFPKLLLCLLLGLLTNVALIGLGLGAGYALDAAVTAIGRLL
jgi:hypothetical protein